MKTPSHGIANRIPNSAELITFKSFSRRKSQQINVSNSPLRPYGQCPPADSPVDFHTSIRRETIIPVCVSIIGYTKSTTCFNRAKPIDFQTFVHIKSRLLFAARHLNFETGHWKYSTLE